jgi:hypothetical protein
MLLVPRNLFVVPLCVARIDDEIHDPLLCIAGYASPTALATKLILPRGSRMKP